MRSLDAWWRALPSMRPLLKLSYAANHASGLGLAGFHAVNLAIHAASAFLAWALLAAWLPRAGVAADAAPWAAWLAALLFALHPAQAEAVTYVSGRSMSLMGLASLGSALAFVRARAPLDRWNAASVALFAVALAVRETAWGLLPALVLLALARGDGGRRTARLVAPHALLLAAAAAAILALPAYRTMAAATLAPGGPAALVLRQVDALAYLLVRPLLLLRVNIDPLVPAHSFADAAWWLQAAGLAALPLVAAWQWRRRPWLAAALLWPLLLLAPGYSVFVRDDPASDRHLYLALLGPAWAVAVALARLPRRAGGVAALALCAALGVATALRNADFLSARDLWGATVADQPANPRAWNNYGWALQGEGDVVGARTAYERALAVDPHYSRAAYNLAKLIEAEAGKGR